MKRIEFALLRSFSASKNLMKSMWTSSIDMKGTEFFIENFAGRGSGVLWKMVFEVGNLFSRKYV